MPRLRILVSETLAIARSTQSWDASSGVTGILLAAVACLDLAVTASAQCGGRWLTNRVDGVPGGFGASWALAALPKVEMVAGGDFTSAGDVGAINIARWNCSSWAALGASVADDDIPQSDCPLNLINP